MKGLKVTVDFFTGARAGGLNARDRRTACNVAWQDEDNSVEVRVVLDETIVAEIDLDAAGVELLDGEDVIDEAIAALPERVSYAIGDTGMAQAHMAAKRLDFDDLVDDDGQPLEGKALAEALHGRGIVGVRRSVVPKPSARQVHEGVLARRRT